MFSCLVGMLSLLRSLASWEVPFPYCGIALLLVAVASLRTLPFVGFHSTVCAFPFLVCLLLEQLGNNSWSLFFRYGVRLISATLCVL